VAIDDDQGYEFGGLLVQLEGNYGGTETICSPPSFFLAKSWRGSSGRAVGRIGGSAWRAGRLPGVLSFTAIQDVGGITENGVVYLSVEECRRALRYSRRSRPMIHLFPLMQPDSDRMGILGRFSITLQGVRVGVRGRPELTGSWVVGEGEGKRSKGSVGKYVSLGES